jgi:carboxymethylenebutenolidase
LAGFHAGGLATDAPDSPHRSAGEVHAEMYFGFADQDPSMTAAQIATLEHTLDEVGARYRSEVYEGAQHGYTMADSAAYDEAARERHFRELGALLQRTVGR